MASVTRTPFSKWDLERFIYTDPALSTTERWVAVQILKTLDNRFRPVEGALMSQALIGFRLHKWRESVNRSVRKLRTLGYFITRWVSVNRSTAQGIKGVTRVRCELGPVLRKLVENESSKPGVCAGQPHGVTLHHPSQTLPASPGTVGSSVVAKSADRRGGAEDQSEFKRKTLAEWPRLAGSKPQPTPTPPAFAELAERQRAAIARGDELELGDEEELARVAYQERRGISASTRERLAGLREELAERRRQPRRLPRSRR
jgi:hypothetical protein